MYILSPTHNHIYMPRGRPPKNNLNQKLHTVPDQQLFDETNFKIVAKNNKKNKNKKQNTCVNQPIDSNFDALINETNNLSLNNEPEQITQVKKRGRKRGRKKKEELDFKPDDVIEYMIRNFPYMGIEKIKDRVLNGLKTKKLMDETPYMLSKFLHNGANHYYDDYGMILNDDCVVVGYFVKNDDGSESKYMIDLNKKDTRSYQEIIDHIESS